VNDVTENLEPENLQNDLVYALACTPDMGICFAARGSGLYRSEDYGINWQMAYESLGFTEPMPTTSIVLSPDMETETAVFTGVPGGVLFSSDVGINWQATSLSTPPPMVSTMAISPNYIEDGVVFVGTAEDGVFRSANRGSQWARWNFGLLDLTAYCIGISPNYAADETLYVGVESGIFRSTNGGRAWREVDLPIGYDPVLSLALSPSFVDDGVIFAGTETMGLLHTVDAGRTWVRLADDLIQYSVNNVILSPDYPKRQDVLILHESGLLISRDNGVSWDSIDTGDEDITTVLAPQGLRKGVELLVGLLDGSVHKVSLTK
jgi:photosystem II stability/assembly factor-like uncharacterized protein